MLFALYRTQRGIGEPFGCDRIVRMINRLQQLYLWACERLYAELAWSYDLVSWLVSWGAWRQWRVAALDYVRGPRVLEIGFGTGTLLATLVERGYQVMGLEYSAAMHRETAKKLTRLGLAAPRVQAPAQAMPFVAGSFDTIIATFPSAYIVDPATLRECARLLRAPSAQENIGCTRVAAAELVEAAKPRLRPMNNEENHGRLVIVMGVSAPGSPLSWLMRLFFPRQELAAPSTDDPLLERFVAAGLAARHATVAQGHHCVHLIVAEPRLP